MLGFAHRLPKQLLLLAKLEIHSVHLVQAWLLRSRVVSSFPQFWRVAHLFPSNRIMEQTLIQPALTESVPSWAKYEARFYCPLCYCAARLERAISCPHDHACCLRKASTHEQALMKAQSRDHSSNLGQKAMALFKRSGMSDLEIDDNSAITTWVIAQKLSDNGARDNHSNM